MGELDTYHLADFIPFGAPAYDRLFMGHNGAFWPASVVGALVGCVALWAAWRGRGRLLGALLALAWGWIGWAWYATSYAALNWAGGRLAWIAWAQAALLLTFAARGVLAEPPRGWPRRVGLGLAAFGLALHPLLDPLFGRDWAGAELFGHTPEPTALLTLGLVLAVGRWRAVALLLPTLVCLEGGLTAQVLGTPGWWIGPLLAAIAWVALAADLRRRPA